MAVNRAAQSARALLEQTAAEVANLPGPALRAIGPVLFQAEKELAQDLAKWLRTVEDGAARFGAQQYRVALVQIRQALRTARGLNPALFSVMNTAGVEAGALALGHLARQAEQFSLLFEHSLRPMPIRPAAVLAEGRKALIPRFRSSAARYGEYVTKDIQRELAVGVARGETFDQLTRRLMRHGGPKGMVTVRGIEGDRGAVSEHIAEGLFKRYRSRAETVVRTETINAYNVVTQDGIEAAHAEDPGFLKRWDAALDWRLCPLCRSLDGKIAKVGERFGSGYEHPPAHPNCRCALTPWHVEWGESVTSVPPAPTVKTDAEAEKERERARAAHAAELEKRLREQEATRAAQRQLAEDRRRAAEAKTKPQQEVAPPSGDVTERTKASAASMAKSIGKEVAKVGGMTHRDEALIRAGFREAATSQGMPMPEFRSRALGKDRLRVMSSAEMTREFGGNANAFHVHYSPNQPEMTGSIALQRDNLKHLQQGLEAIGRGQVGELNRRAALGDWEARDQLNAVRTMMHETLHGMESTGSAMGVAETVSEVSVELTARFLATEVFGIAPESVGAYQGLIDSLTAQVAELGGWSAEEAGRRLGDAAVRMFTEPEWNVYGDEYAARLGRNIFGDAFDKKKFMEALHRTRGLIVR